MENMPIWSHFYISIQCQHAGIPKKNEPCQNLTSQNSGDFRNVSPGQLPMFCLQLGGFLRRRAPVDASEALQALHPALQRGIDRFHGATFRARHVSGLPKKTARPGNRAVFTHWICGIRLFFTLDGCAAHFLLAPTFGWNTFYSSMARYIVHVWKCDGFPLPSRGFRTSVELVAAAGA